jgi:hypothetical protein
MSKYFSFESKRLNELNGIRLADFHQRAIAFLVDATIALALLMMGLLVFGFARWLVTTGGDMQHPYHLHIGMETSQGKFLCGTAGACTLFRAGHVAMERTHDRKKADEDTGRVHRARAHDLVAFDRTSAGIRRSRTGIRLWFCGVFSRSEQAMRARPAGGNDCSG